MKKGLITVFVIAAFSALLTLSICAEGGRAPGGTVTNQQELFEALGGEENCLLNSDGVLLCFDAALKNPIVLDGGEYTLTGAGAKLASLENGCVFELRNGASLTLGNLTGSSADGIIFEGTGTARLLEIGDGCTANVLFGVSASGFSRVVTNSGAFALYAGTFENCGDADWDGGFLLNYGTALLAGGTVRNCFAAIGGAVYNHEGGTLSLAGTEIGDCHADTGGAVMNAGEAEIVSSYVSGCYATDGGAVYNSGTFAFFGGQISGSVAHGDGGAVYNSETGEIRFSGTFIDGSTADGNGGTVFCAGKGSLTEGTLSGGTAKKGGNLYVTGEFELTGGSVSHGTATLGGGAFNCGTVYVKGGGFSLCTADFGSALFNTGRLVFSEYPYIDKKYDVFVDLNNPDGIPEIASEMKAETICFITPGRYSGDTASTDYTPGTLLLQGEYAAQCSGHFAVSPQGGREWKIEDGRLAAVKTMWERPWIYIGTVLLWAAFVAVTSLLGIRFSGKKHEKGK